MRKILGILLMAFSSVSFAQTQLYQPDFKMQNGKKRYLTIQNIPGGGVETQSYLYYDLNGGAHGREIIQWFPGYHREIILYPPDKSGRVYKTQRVSKKRNSKTDFSPIIVEEFKGYIN